MWGVQQLKSQVSANLGFTKKVNEMQEVHLGNLSNVLLAGDLCVNSVKFFSGKIAKKNTLASS